MSHPTFPESWTSWLLSSFASSISSHAEPSLSPAMPTTEDLPPARNPSTPTSSSPYGPYARTGRGGAGNFTWQSSSLPSASSLSSSETIDLEAQPQPNPSLACRQKAALESEAQDRSFVLRTRPAPEYLHLGRGGAGNYTSSFSRSSSTDLPTKESLLSPTLPSSTGGSSSLSGGGRGGAGNLHASQEKAERMRREREEAERRIGEDLKGQAESEAESVIRPPTEARLAGPGS